jgi:hypothetical protein
MTKLYKLDLEPNEIYNVSLNIKQGNKTLDNLRFFQTKVPKLFNLKPSNFSTSSQIIEESDGVTTKVLDDGISDGGPSKAVEVESVSWKSKPLPNSREDGVTSYEPSGMLYTFTITFKSAPSFTSYYLSGFKGELDFLNYRTDYKISGSKLTLTISLADIDPSATTKYIVKTGTPYYRDIVDTITAGSTTVYLSSSTDLSKIVPGKSRVIALEPIIVKGVNYGSAYVWKDTAVIKVGKFSDDKGRKLVYMTMGKTSSSKMSAGRSIAIYGVGAGYTFTGDAFGRLKWKGSASASDAAIKFIPAVVGPPAKAAKPAANIVWQTFPSYNAKDAKTEYTFKKSSHIRSSVINPNIIEKLIWEDEVRDYIYFVITDVDDKNGDGKKYFFGTYGPKLAMKTLATENKSLTGTFVFNPKSPPAAHGDIVNPDVKTYTASSGKVKYYQGTDSNETGSVPALVRKIQVQFAIARYTKTDTGGWKAEWLPGRTENPAEILSTPEALE